MTKRKRQQPTIQEILERPWCYYCERDFDDLKILISHQKAKHYKCSMCNRRLNTAGGLSVHMSQVHKETLQYIENALPNRKDASVEIFGMEGIPATVLDAHRQRITTEYFKMVAERRAETGNPPAGAQSNNPAKKLKIETPEEIKQRLAEHRAKKQAEALGLGGDDRSSATPSNAESPFTAPGSEPLPVGPSPVLMQNSPQPPFPPQFPVPQGVGYMPPAMSPFQGPPAMYGMPPVMPMHSPPPGFHGVPPGIPPPPMHVAPPPRAFNHSGPQSSLPRPPIQNSPLETDVPGLPARPPVAAPQYSREDMARMHAGAPARGVPNPATQTGQLTGIPDQTTPVNARESSEQTIDDSVQATTDNTAQDRLTVEHSEIAIHKKESTATTESKTAETSKKSGKKSKAADTKTKLVYSDNAISPEEKRASLSRYSFKREEATDYVLGDAGPAVTGPVRGADDVMDAQSAH